MLFGGRVRPEGWVLYGKMRLVLVRFRQKTVFPKEDEYARI